MHLLWQLVLIALTTSAGSSRASHLEDFEELNKEEARRIPFLTRSDVLAETKFQCRDKPSGYYADPRFDCKVFHYCQEDGARVTIPCDGRQQHKICAFRDIAFNACEGSEIYLALPEDLDAARGETTDSTADATDFELSSVLPQPPADAARNHSTTPLSLNLERPLASPGDEGVFEVFNTVLREIRTDDLGKIPAREANLSPSTFSRGSKFRAPPKDDPQKEGAYLVEIYHKKDGKLSGGDGPVLKKSKKLFFLPGVEKERPAVYPRRKKRTVLDGSRPFAILYTEVPDNRRVLKSKAERKSENLRKDLSQVPFVAARVPVDVPTVPIAIETRRKKKSKSKKSKTSPEGGNGQPREKNREQTSEQQNILLFAAEPIIGLESINDRNVINNRVRPNQDTAKQAETQYRNNGPTVQNPLQGNYHTFPNEGINPSHIPGIHFQSPNAYLTNSAPPQFYLQPQDVQQPGNFPSFNLYDQISRQPNQPEILLPNAFQPPNTDQSQSNTRTGNSNPQTRQPDGHSRQRPRQSNQHQKPDQSQSQRQQNIVPQVARPPENSRQTNRQTENSRQNNRLADSIPSQTIRQPEFILDPHSQSEVPHSNQPDNYVHSFRQPGNVRQQEGRNPQISHPEGQQLQVFNSPEGTQTRAAGHPEGAHAQTPGHPQGIRAQTVRHRESILPHTIRQPEDIQPQSLRQLQNIYLQNVPTFSLGQPETSFPPSGRQPQANEQHTAQPNEPDRNKIDRERLQGLQPNIPPQIYPGFENAFFQEFPGFGPLTYDGPYPQSPPQSFDLFAPPAVRFQEQLNPQQHTEAANRAPPQALQTSEQPKAPFVPQDVPVGRPPNARQQQYGNSGPQQNPEPGIGHAYPVQNSHLAETERAKQERERTVGAPPFFSDVRDSRSRTRPNPATDGPSTGDRNYGPQNDQHRGRPQEDSERPPQHSSNYNRRPNEAPRPPSEAAYRPHRPSEVSGIPNEIRHPQPPTTVEIPDVRQRERPQQSGRESPIETAQRQRNREYHYDGRGGHHTTHHYARATAPPRQRTRQPELPPSRERFRETNRGQTFESGDRPGYEHRPAPPPQNERTRTSPERQQQPPGVPVTNRYFVTTAPRTRPPEEEGPRGRRPQYLSEIPDERSRRRPPSPQAQIERPPPDYGPPREEYPRPQRHNSNRVPNRNRENDVNVISTAEDPSFRRQTTPRPGYDRHRPEIVHGFVPVSERAQRHTTRAPERERPRTPEYEYSHASRSPDREQIYATRAPERGHSYETRTQENGYNRAPEREHAHSRHPETEYPRTTRAPVREYAYTTRIPEEPEYSYTTRSPRVPEREYSYTTRNPEREHPPRVPEREHRNPDTDGTRGTRNQNYREEAPTTTPRTTQKPRPLPPRPTFPAFPTFPPPPRRIVTSPRPKTTEAPEDVLRESDNDDATAPALDDRESKADVVTDAPEQKRRVTDNHVTTDEPEVTTRRRSRKRRPRPRRPKTTTPPYSDEAEEAVQVETITQATTRREVVTRSNFNRWRQQTQAPSKPTSTTTPSTTTPSGSDGKTEEYGSRINLFGRPRTRKPTSFAPRTSTTTPAAPIHNERKRVTKLPTVTRTRKPFVKKVRKKAKTTTTTTTEAPETTEPVARSDEDDDFERFDSDINYQELESATQLSVEKMEELQTTTTEAYNDMMAETTTEAFTEIYEETTTDPKDKTDDGTRSVLKKFQNRPRVLKFRKPRLRVTESPLDLNVAESK